MRHGFLALIVLLLISSATKAQDLAEPTVQPFRISSLNTPFAMQGDFEGEYRIYSDRIELRIIKATILISDHCPYKGRRLFSSLKFGLATNTAEGRWRPTSWSQNFVLEEVMSPGDQVDLVELSFTIPKDKALDLSKHWLVVQMADTALDLPGRKLQEGYALAKSCRDIFAPR